MRRAAVLLLVLFAACGEESAAKSSADECDAGERTATYTPDPDAEDLAERCGWSTSTP